MEKSRLTREKAVYVNVYAGVYVHVRVNDHDNVNDDGHVNERSSREVFSFVNRGRGR